MFWFLSEAVVRRDHDYWADYLKPMLGNGITEDSTVAEVAAFAQKVYLRHDLDGFTGDPDFVADTWAQKSYAKLRCAIAGVYAWHSAHDQSPADQARMTRAADRAFLQAYALCPGSPEVIFRYTTLLTVSHRVSEAILLAETSEQFDPQNQQIKDLVTQLKASPGEQKN